MGKILQFTDWLNLEPITPIHVLKDQLVANKKQFNGKDLFLKVAATHSGIVTRNKGFYLPDKMRASESTWMQHYAKPVDKHHATHSDPIGRVLNARYVDITATLQDSVLSALDQDFQRLIEGRLSIKDSVNYVADKLNSSGILQNPGYPGAGYMELTAKISDEDSIQKILDGRLLTCSTIQTTTNAFCSICKEDWSLGKDSCDHKPGKQYKGKECFIIAGDLEGRALSFVSEPADPFSQVIDIIEDGKISDSIRVEDTENNSTIQERPYEIILSDSIKPEDILSDHVLSDSVNIKTLTDKRMIVSAHDGIHYRYDYEINNKNTDVTISKEDVDLHLKLHQEAKTGDFLNSLMAGPLDEVLTDKSLYPQVITVKGRSELRHMDKIQEESTVLSLEDMLKEVQQQEEVEKAKLKDCFTAFKAGTIKDTDVQEVLKDHGLTAEQMAILIQQLAQMEAAESMWSFIADAEWETYNKVVDEEFEKVWEEEIEKIYSEAGVAEDAKLTTAQRKKMSGSTFCGPNRSFPIPDCAHVTAARRLIGRAKVGAATKSRILSCVSRKARALGCGGAKEDSVQAITEALPAASEVGSTSPLSFAQVVTWLGDQVAFDKDSFNTVLTKKWDMQIVTNDSVKGLQDKVKELETKLNAGICSVCEKNRQALSDEKATVKILREEYRLLLADMQELTSALVDSETSYRGVLAGHVLDLERLKDSKFEDGATLETRLETLLKDSTETLVQKKTSLSEVVDITKISDKLNSGMANSEPSGNVVDPIKKIGKDGRVLIDRKAFDEINAEIVKLQMGGQIGSYKGPIAIRQYVSDQVAKGRISQEFLDGLFKGLVDKTS